MIKSLLEQKVRLCFKATLKQKIFSMLIFLCSVSQVIAQSNVTIDPAVKYQVIDGFGTCLSGTEGESTWMQNLYYDDAGCSILRMDIVPRFVSPYSDNSYNSPWFHNNPPLPGPDGNNVRTYTNASDYTRLFNNTRAQIAVMGPDINQNIQKFDYNNDLPRVAGAMAKAGLSRKSKLGDFKLTASMWSPAPWLKISSGNKYGGSDWPLPTANTPFPFIWFDNFTGGKLDVSNTPLPEFFDGVQNTSALTQFARSTAAYVKGFQDTYKVSFYSISIQNELNFETFYNSCTYPLSSQYIAALKAVRAEFDKYTDLKDIKIMGPEDLLGSDAYGLWEYGNASNPVDKVVHKNLQYLTEIAKDPQASAALDFFCIHGYAPDGVSSAGANSSLWNWWANGWTTSPAGGIPADIKGFKFYNKKSWMTETSGEEAAWLAPSSGFPNNGAFSVALKMDQALQEGQESAWIYWQFSDGNAVSGSTITDAQALGSAPKYNAFKHFAKYVRPNARRVNTTVTGTGVRASSYIQETDKTLTIVLINSNSSAQEVTVNVPDMAFTVSSFDAFTSSNNDYWKNSKLTVSQKKVTISVPGYGVTTLYGTGTGVVDSTPPSAPSNLASSSVTSNSVLLTWGASTDNISLAGYDVYRGTTKVNTSLITTTSYTVTDLTASTAYTFTVKAKDAAGNESAASNSVNVTTLAPPADVKATGTAFGTSPWTGCTTCTFDKAFDNNTSTYFDANDANGAYTGIDAGSAKTVTRIRFYPRSGNTARMVGGKFQGSNTSSSTGFVDLHTISTEPTLAWREVAVNSTTAYRYLRYLAPNGGHGNVAEIEFYVSTSTSNLRDPENPSNTVAGLEYKYYEGTWSTLPNFETLTAAKTGNVSNFDMTVRNRTDNYGFQYKGFVNVATDGTYTFYTSSDDGSKLFIGNTEVVNNDGLHGTLERSGTINLKAGKHAITVIFFEAGGGEVLSVSYSGPSLTKQLIPNAALFRAGAATTLTKATGTAFGTAPWVSCTTCTADKAFDNNTSTYFDANDANGAYTGIDAGTARVVTRIRFYPRSSNLERMVGGKFQGSNTSSSSGYVDLYTVPSQPTNAWQQVDISNTTGYRYLRYLAPNGGYGNVAEIEFYYNGSSTARTSNVAASEEGAFGDHSVQLYPNPVDDNLHVDILSDENGEADLSLANVSGKEVLRLKKSLQKGNNKVTIPINGYSNGFYLLKITNGKKHSTHKVLIK